MAAEKQRYTEDDKKAAVKAWLEGASSYMEISKKMRISSGMLSAWKRKYFPDATTTRTRSKLAPLAVTTNQKEEDKPVSTTKLKTTNRYPQEIIDAAVRRFNNREKTAIALAAEYGTSATMIYMWVKKAKKHAGQTAVAMANGMSLKDMKSGKPHIARDDILRDVIIYLKRGRDSVMNRIRSGDLKSPDEAHNLMLLALSALEH